MPQKEKLYLSFDIETDGDTPVLNNMLGIGIYGLDKDLNKIFTFDANILPLPNHFPSKSCMENFWNKEENQAAWAYLQMNQRDYVEVCVELSNLLTELKSQYDLVWVAAPASFDFAFLKAYYEMANIEQSKKGKSLCGLGHSCRCGSTLWNIYKEKHNLSNSQADELKKTLGEFNPGKEHFALEDARFQGTWYVKAHKLLTMHDKLKFF